MGTALAEAFVEVRPDLDEFGPQLKRGIESGPTSTHLTGAGTSAGRKLGGGLSKGVKGSMGGLGKTVAAGFGGAALFAGVKALGGAFMEMGRNAAADEKGQRRLAKSLQNSTGATAAGVSAVEDWISKTASATGVTDDQLRPAFERLARSTGDVGKAQDEMALALNISAGTGKSVEAVAAALAKGNDGNTASLARLGLKVKDSSGKLMSYKDIHKKLADQFQGQSAAAAESVEGKMARLTNNFDEAKEAIGAKLLPIAGAFSDFLLTKLGPALSVVGGWVQKNSGWLIPLVAVFGTAVTAIFLVVKAMQAWTAIQIVFNTVLAANPIGIVIVALAAIAAGLVIAYKRSEKFRNVVQAVGRVIVSVWQGIRAGADAMWEVLKTIFKWSPYGIIFRNFGKIMGFFKGLPGKLTSALSTVAEVLTWPFRTAFNAIARLWNATIGKISFTIPSWVPGVGGKGFSFPTIPMLAKGGTAMSRGSAIVGENGPELVTLERGASVIPLSGKHGGGVVVESGAVVVHYQGNMRSEMEDVVNIAFGKLVRELRSS